MGQNAVTYAESVTELSFEPPGPGPWVQDSVHFPRPATRYWAEMHPEPFSRGTHEFARYHGMLLAGLDAAYINGFAYNSRPPIADEEFPERAARAHQVFESTSEAFNILLPLLGAIVTDSGGLLSHPAIVAREYGIPGVVGTRDATDRIPDGARVRVDGDAGEVTVLD